MRRVALILFGCLALLTKAEAEDGLAHHYSGSLSELNSILESSGYTHIHGYLLGMVNIQNAGITKHALSAEQWCILDSKQNIVVKRKRCINTIEIDIGRDSNGIRKHQIEDALELVPTSGFDFLDVDSSCSDKNYPKNAVIAVGQWNNRKPPRIGGFADSIKQAWIVDTALRKFAEILPKEVVCEINEDRD